jgi:hypothetical protein
MARQVALTVDVEPDWAVRGTRAFREVAPRFLRFLEERRMRATFFVVSDLMAVSPGLVAELAERNEVGSHGCTHRLLDRLNAEEVEHELRASRERLAQVARRVVGFRAPFFRRPRGFFRSVRKAGYRYDASLGSVMPGPLNRRLSELPCPFRRGGVQEFPTSAMAGGMLPLSLTWLRLLWPLSGGQMPQSASLLYLHLHEFLPPETASCLPLALRRVLARNCGETAWRVLDEALEALDAEFVACGDRLGPDAGAL